NELIAVVPVPAGSTHRLEIPAPDDLAPGGFTAVLCVDLGLKGTPEIDPTDLLASPDAPYFALSYFVQVPVRVIR
ncbi:MAG: hypothetical protein Q8M55_00350, partial [Actinomycetota bacterium]|nr:hypothetical protein [Actinomycetota bacterium]